MCSASHSSVLSSVTSVQRARTGRRAAPTSLAQRSSPPGRGGTGRVAYDDPRIPIAGDVVGGVTQLGENLLGVLAEIRGPRRDRRLPRRTGSAAPAPSGRRRGSPRVEGTRWQRTWGSVYISSGVCTGDHAPLAVTRICFHSSSVLSAKISSRSAVPARSREPSGPPRARTAASVPRSGRPRWSQRSTQSLSESPRNKTGEEPVVLRLVRVHVGRLPVRAPGGGVARAQHAFGLALRTGVG